MDNEQYSVNILHKPTKPNGKEWCFYEFGIACISPTSTVPSDIAEPINIAPVIQGIIDNELTNKDGFFSYHYSPQKEDVSLDDLLCVDAYGMKCSFQPFLSELKTFGVTDLFGQDLTKCIFRVLKDIGQFIKDNTDKPQAIKNHITSMLDVFSNIPIISAMARISVMRGLEMFYLECRDTLEGYGVAEVESMLLWVGMEECKMISSFTIMPFEMGVISAEVAEHIKPFTDYLYSTEIGKLANDTTLATLYGCDITDNEPAKKEVPQEFTTPAAKIVLQKAIGAGLLDADFMPIGLTQAQKKAFAIGMGLECGFFGKHLKPFKTYWGVDNLGQVHIEAHSEESIKNIKRLFSAPTRQKMQEIIYGK
jgi:hypothetical protein